MKKPDKCHVWSLIHHYVCHDGVSHAQHLRFELYVSAGLTLVPCQSLKPRDVQLTYIVFILHRL